MKRTLLQAIPTFKFTRPGVPNPSVEFAGATNEVLYSLRRDRVGVSGTRIARMSAPDPSTEGAGCVHLRREEQGFPDLSDAG